MATTTFLPSPEGFPRTETGYQCQELGKSSSISCLSASDPGWFIICTGGLALTRAFCYHKFWFPEPDHRLRKQLGRGVPPELISPLFLSLKTWRNRWTLVSFRFLWFQGKISKKKIGPCWGMLSSWLSILQWKYRTRPHWRSSEFKVRTFLNTCQLWWE